MLEWAHHIQCHCTAEIHTFWILPLKYSKQWDLHRKHRSLLNCGNFSCSDLPRQWPYPFNFRLSASKGPHKVCLVGMICTPHTRGIEPTLGSGRPVYVAQPDPMPVGGCIPSRVLLPNQWGDSLTAFPYPWVEWGLLMPWRGTDCSSYKESIHPHLCCQLRWEHRYASLTFIIL